MAKKWIVRVFRGPGTRADVSRHDTKVAAYVDVDAAIELRKSGAPIKEIEVYTDEGHGLQLHETFN
jgi:hypothetical protein